ncbi:MAG: G1 family glutamic endopeptidase [Candidatus Bathyarchaeia archaeon]
MRKILTCLAVILLCSSMFTVFQQRAIADPGDEDVIFFDDFESYAVGTFPSAGGWTLVYNGKGNEYQKIVDDVSFSGSKSFQLWGVPGWSACADKAFTPTKRYVGYEAYVMTAGYGPENMAIHFMEYNTPALIASVNFGVDSKIYSRSYAPEWYTGIPPGPVYDLNMTYVANRWYKVKVVVDRNTNTYDVWIDDTLRGHALSTQNSANIGGLRLGSGHSGVKVYFDNTKVFQVEITKALVGYWKLDEGSGTIASDSSDNGNIGTLINGPQWIDGVVGTALAFDGIDDYVHVPSSNSLTITGNQITVEMWLRPATLLDDTAPFINFIDKGNEYGFQISQDGYKPTPDGKIWFYVGLDLSGWHWEGIQTTTNQWIANKWYHLAGTYDGNSLKIYVNGILENSRLLSGNLFAQGAYPLSIGSYTLGNQYFFNGAIDEVKIYNYARTPEEIWNDYISIEQKTKILGMEFYIPGSWERSFSFPNGTTFTLKSFLEKHGFDVDISSEVFSGTITLDGLLAYDAVILPQVFFDVPGNVAYESLFEQYANQGGGLIFLGQAAVPEWTLDEQLGFHFVTIQAWSYYVDARITDTSHPIMFGITELPKAGGVFVDWDTLIADSPLPPNTAVLARSVGSGGTYDPDNVIALIAFQHGLGRVVAGPLDGMIRPYGPTTVDGWDVVSEPVIENKLLINAIKWVARSVVNQPPLKPTINGPVLCTLFDENGNYLGPWEYGASATDPDGDDVRITFAWDDGTPEEQSNMVPSGTTVWQSHSWFSAGARNTGMHKVKAKTVDIYGAESDWSSPLEVTVVANKLFDIWAGYFVKSDLTTKAITSITGEWIQPAFNVPEGASYQATWVGIGGIGTRLLQAGIAELKLWKTFSDKPAMMPFWMTVDEKGKGLYWIDFLHTADPGDIISTSITEDSLTPGLWHIRVEDRTKSWVFLANVKFDPDQTTAEWVHEPGAKKSGVASFNPITFLKAELTIGGVNCKLGRIDPTLKTYLFMINYKKGKLVLTSVSPIREYEQFSISYTGTTPLPADVETTVSLHSNANLHVYDSTGNHLGYNVNSGFIDQQIPNSMYFEDEQGAQYALLFETNAYQIELVGKKYGEFHLNIVVSFNGTVVLDEWFNGTIAEGIVEYYTLFVRSNEEAEAISWDYVFRDARRGTTLKISTDDNYFQFVAPDKDFGIKHDANMKVFNHIILIRYEDNEMRIVATAVDHCINFCSAIVKDKQTSKYYMLIDKPNWPKYCCERFTI